MWLSLLLACSDEQIAVRGTYSAWLRSDHGEVHDEASGAVVRVIRDEGADCAALRQATYLALIVVVEEQEERRPLHGEVSPPSVLRVWTLQLQASGGAAVGLRARWQAVLQGAVGWRIGQLHIQAGVSATLPAIEPVRLGSAQATLLHGTIGACYVPSIVTARLRAAICGAAWIGATQGRTQDLEESWSEWRPSVYLVPSVGLRWAFARPFELAVDVAAPIAVLQPSFTVEGFGPVLQGSRISFLASAGIAVSIL